MSALPVVGQLGDRLPRSPQRVRGDKALGIKRLVPREQVIHGAGELVGEHGQRFGFAMFMFEFHKIRFPRLALPNEEDCRCGTGPAQRDGADLFPGRPEPFAS